MSFVSFFKSEIPAVLVRLKVARLELCKTQNDLERLLILEQNLSPVELSTTEYETLIKKAIDDYGVALWIKDKDGQFIFANRACCDSVLRCREEDVVNPDGEIINRNAFANECKSSDRSVMKSGLTKRFIAHAVYENGGEIFLDIIKSPRMDSTGVIGTVGSGVIITESIPKNLRNQKRVSCHIEIPLTLQLGTRKLAQLFERRSSGARTKKLDKKYRKERSGFKSLSGQAATV